MGDVLVKSNGPRKKTGKTVGVKELGFEPKEGVNPDIMSRRVLTEEDLEKILDIADRQQSGELSEEEANELTRKISRGESIEDDMPVAADQPASKFMEGTDERTSEGRRNVLLRRVHEEPGLLDNIMEMNDIDPELARQKIANQGLRGEEATRALLDDITQGTAPTLTTGEQVAVEGRKTQAQRKRALQRIAEGEDPQEVGVIRGRGGRDRGRVFAQTGRFEPLEGEELQEAKRKLGSLKIGADREKALNEMGLSMRGNKIGRTIQPRTEYRGEVTGEEAPPPELTEEQAQRIREEGAEERVDKLERLKEKRDRLQSKLSGRSILPAKQGDFDPAEVERIRVGAQDELRSIDKPEVKYPSHLQSLQAFANSLGLRNPVHPAYRGVTLSQSARSVEEGGKRGKVTPENLAEYEADKANYIQQMKALPEEFERQRKAHAQQHLKDLGALGEEIQQRIPEYVKETGVKVMPSVGREFAQRRNREGEVVRDAGQKQSVYGHVMSQLEGDDEVNAKWWQMKAHELGFDLDQDEDFVNAMENLGLDVGDNDFPTLARGAMKKPTEGGSYGKRVHRRRKQFSADRPVGTEGSAEDEQTARLKQAHSLGMKAIAKFLESHFSEIPLEEANEHMPSYAQITAEPLSGDERANLLDQLNQLNNEIDSQQRQRDFIEEQDARLTPESFAEMGRKFAIREAQKTDDYTRRQIDLAAQYFAYNQPQARFLRDEKLRTERDLESAMSYAQREGDDEEVRRIGLKLRELEDQIDNFDRQEQERLRQPLIEAVKDHRPMVQDYIDDAGTPNLQIPSHSHEKLPDVTTMRMGGRKGDRPDLAKPEISLDVLEAKLDAANAQGDEAAVKEIESQIRAVKGREMMDEIHGGELDYGKEPYVHYTTDPEGRTRVETKRRKAGHLTGRSLKGMTDNEITDFILAAFMDDHKDAMKEGRRSIVDGYATGEKHANEQLYRDIGQKLIDDRLKQHMSSMGPSEEEEVLGSMQLESLIQEIENTDPSDTEKLDRLRTRLEVLQMSELPEYRRQDLRERAGLDAGSQVPPEGTGSGAPMPAGSSEIAVKNPLTPSEKGAARRGAAREKAAHLKRTEGQQTQMDKVRRLAELGAQGQSAKEIQELAARAQGMGMDISGLQGQPEAPPVEQPAPEAQPEAPPVEQPAPEAPPVEQPAPEAPPAPASAAPEGSPFASEPPNPFAGMQDLPGLGAPAGPPANVTVGQQGGMPLTQEQEAQLAAISNDDSLSEEEKNAMVQQFVANLQKSTFVRPFDSTVGDDLLKSIKDRFWRQGY